MALDKITHVSGSPIPVLGDDIDTDRIIPARFMKCVTFDGLGEFAFYDAIKEAEAAGSEYPFGSEKFASGSVLISGANFGCGSSREHAPQALYRAGVRAIIAESFAEIFFGNSITLGMPCVCLDREKLNELVEASNKDANMTISIDIESGKITAGSWEANFTLTKSAKKALLEGKWDPIAELLESDVDGVAQKQAYIAGY
jgi:3-isopropylmalate/(R)-2-methylmalate dehydratase small subunit